MGRWVGRYVWSVCYVSELGNDKNQEMCAHLCSIWWAITGYLPGLPRELTDYHKFPSGQVKTGPIVKITNICTFLCQLFSPPIGPLFLNKNSSSVCPWYNRAMELIGP